MNKPEMFDSIKQACWVSQTHDVDLAAIQPLHQIVDSNVGWRTCQHFLSPPHTLGCSN